MNLYIFFRKVYDGWFNFPFNFEIFRSCGYSTKKGIFKDFQYCNGEVENLYIQFFTLENIQSFAKASKFPFKYRNIYRI